MRSRPKISLYLQPAAPVPGSRLVAELRLLSRSETPVDRIVLRLTGSEQRYRGAVTTNNVSMSHYDTADYVSLLAKTDALVLGKGEHRQRFQFDLPTNIPPSYRSRLTLIQYEIDVRVEIPWWPDRHERFAVPLLPTPLPPSTLGARVLCTTDGGPSGTDLYLEVSLDRTQLDLGESIEGAVSVANVRFHRVRRVEVSFVALEADGSNRWVQESQRLTAVILEGAPTEGQPIPFRIAFPKDAPTTFTTGLTRVTWGIEIRAVVALGRDVTLSAPLFVSSPHPATAGPKKLDRVPPVGSERRALVWAEVAQRAGMRNEAEAERMTREVDDVSVTITLEHRGDAGIHSVAALSFPALGVDLAVTERKWVDGVTGGSVELADPLMRRRFTVRGREAAQIEATFDAELCGALVAIPSVVLHDEDGLLAAPGGAHAADDLLLFVRRVLAIAHALGGAPHRIPPPARMAEHVPQWRAFAARVGARLELGRVYLHGATRDGESFDIGTAWNDKAEPEATVVSLTLEAPPEEEGGPTKAKSATLAKERKKLDYAVHALGGEVTVSLHAVEARLPGPVADPARLEPLLDVMASFAKASRGQNRGGPYR